jgi:hypothetical protein
VQARRYPLPTAAQQDGFLPTGQSPDLSTSKKPSRRPAQTADPRYFARSEVRWKTQKIDFIAILIAKLTQRGIGPKFDRAEDRSQ